MSIPGRHRTVEAFGLHDDLDGVGDDLTGDQGEVHALVAHGDAVGDGDGAELQRVTATGVHTLLGRLSEPVQRQVARGDLVPRARDADLGLVPVGVAHPDGAEHPSGSGGFDAVRDVAATGFHIELRHAQSLERRGRAGRHARDV
jgi:hypothetical protein